MTALSQPVQRRPAIRWRRVASQAQDLTLIAVTAFFIFIHARELANGHWTSAPFAAEQVILVALFLFRRRSIATSTRPFDWTVAAIGGWLPLAGQLHPAGGALGASGFGIQLAGIMLASLCFIALGRSFGIVAANRGLKTHGPYRLVRHPIYVAHLISFTGFVVANPHVINVVIWAVVLAAQVMRIRAEERVLSESGDYANYSARVRYRILPGVF